MENQKKAYDKKNRFQENIIQVFSSLISDYLVQTTCKYKSIIGKFTQFFQGNRPYILKALCSLYRRVSTR
jgi:hypothetical protein